MTRLLRCDVRALAAVAFVCGLSFWRTRFALDAQQASQAAQAKETEQAARNARAASAGQPPESKVKIASWGPALPGADEESERLHQGRARLDNPPSWHDAAGEKVTALPFSSDFVSSYTALASRSAAQLSQAASSEAQSASRVAEGHRVEEEIGESLEAAAALPVDLPATSRAASPLPPRVAHQMVSLSPEALRRWHGDALVFVGEGEGQLRGMPERLDVDLRLCMPQESPGGAAHDGTSYKILSVEETARFLERGGSIARFGDGEWKLQATSDSHTINRGMEAGSKRLMKKLRQIPRVGGKSSGNFYVRAGKRKVPFCVGIVPLWDDATLSRGTPNFKAFHIRWRKQFAEDKSATYFPPGTYCSTSITRPDHRIDLREEWWLDKWQGLARGKRVLYVGPEDIPLNREWKEHEAFDAIFACAVKVVRVYIPPKQAFASHDTIVARIVKAWHAEDLQLAFITAGPLGTVLGAELPCIGIPALDAGHIYKKMKQFTRVNLTQWHRCKA